MVYNTSIERNNERSLVGCIGTSGIEDVLMEAFRGSDNLVPTDKRSTMLDGYDYMVNLGELSYMEVTIKLKKESEAVNIALFGGPHVLRVTMPKSKAFRLSLLKMLTYWRSALASDASWYCHRGSYPSLAGEAYDLHCPMVHPELGMKLKELHEEVSALVFGEPRAFRVISPVGKNQRLTLLAATALWLDVLVDLYSRYPSMSPGARQLFIPFGDRPSGMPSFSWRKPESTGEWPPDAMHA